MSAKNGLIMLGHNAATNIEQAAAELAGTVGPAVINAIETVTKAKEDWEGSKPYVMIALEKEYDISSSFPDPTVLTGDFPAKYETSKIGTDRKKKTTIVDFYEMFFDKTATGVRYQQELDWIKRLRNKDDGRMGIDPDFIETYSNEMLRAEREVWLRRRRKVAIGSYRGAVQLAYQLEKVNAIEGVVAVLLYTDGTKSAVRNTPEPVQVYVPGEGGAPASKWENYSVSSFLRLDTEKAMESETPFEALQESLRRKKTGGDSGDANKSDAKPQLVATTDTAYARTMDILSFYDDAVQDKTRAKLGVIRKAMRPGEGNGYFMSSYALMLALMDIHGSEADKARYESLRQEAEKAAA